MFHRLPVYQAPRWLIALLIGLGVALDVQSSYHNHPQPDQMNPSHSTHKQVVDNGFLQDPERDNRVVDR